MQFLNRGLRQQPSAQALIYFRDSGFLRYLLLPLDLADSGARSSLSIAFRVQEGELEESTRLRKLALQHQISLATEAR